MNEQPREPSGKHIWMILFFGLFVSLQLAVKSPDAVTVEFTDVTRQAGIDFQHRRGSHPNKYLVETMGSGGGFLDFDRDGWWDLYLIQSGGHQSENRPANQLYRNNRDGTFQLVQKSGAEDNGYGMGVVFGDYDNDGWTDIYITNFGPNRLFRNLGDGSFEEVAARAGVDDPAWGTSAAFADVNGDGFLDLYVANYLEFSYSSNVQCGDLKNPSYCHPDVYPAAPNSFFLNNGDGTFRAAAKESGLVPDNPDSSKSLGVLFFDFDNDLDQDLYVANDSTANFLFENRGRGRFVDISLTSGAAYNRDGETEAGMGVDAADTSGSGRFDLVVTHLDFETNTLYINEDGRFFDDQSETRGVGGPSRTRVGFGVNFADFNNDSWPDLFVANGHVIDTIEIENPSIQYAQPNQLLINLEQGRFADRSAEAGHPFRVAEVSRGSAVADYDRDGDLDILVTNNQGPARLLMNQSSRNSSRNWLQFTVAGEHCNRDAIGARVTVKTTLRQLTQEVRSASGYCSQSETSLHFGLGRATSVEAVEVRWPCGRRQQLGSLRTNRRHQVKEEN